MKVVKYFFGNLCLNDIHNIKPGDLIDDFIVVACIVAPPTDRLQMLSKVILELRLATEPNIPIIGAFEVSLNRPADSKFSVTMDEFNLNNVYSCSVYV